jgi:hypothetical protein
MMVRWPKLVASKLNNKILLCFTEKEIQFVFVVKLLCTVDKDMFLHKNEKLLVLTLSLKKANDSRNM